MWVRCTEKANVLGTLLSLQLADFLDIDTSDIEMKRKGKSLYIEQRLPLDFSNSIGIMPFSDVFSYTEKDESVISVLALSRAGNLPVVLIDTSWYNVPGSLLIYVIVEKCPFESPFLYMLEDDGMLDAWCKSRMLLPNCDIPSPTGLSFMDDFWISSHIFTVIILS